MKYGFRVVLDDADMATHGLDGNRSALTRRGADAGNELIPEDSRLELELGVERRWCLVESAQMGEELDGIKPLAIGTFGPHEFRERLDFGARQALLLRDLLRQVPAPLRIVAPLH